MARRDNSLVLAAIDELRRRLPPTWSIDTTLPSSQPVTHTILRIADPNGASAHLICETRVRLTPKDAIVLGHLKPEQVGRFPRLVVSPYLSPSTRERLRHRGISHLDLTGNAFVAIHSPGLFIQTQGSSTDPYPRVNRVRSLGGRKTARIVRSLVDVSEPQGVRTLASATGVDAGYISRILALLDGDCLVTRNGQGRLVSVDWLALLRRWAHDAPLTSRGESTTYVEPRGAGAVLAKLVATKQLYALTGGIAAANYAPVAQPDHVVAWVDDARALAQHLGLWDAATPQCVSSKAPDPTGNVTLIEPYDASVFEGITRQNDLSFAAPSQVAADLLIAQGRSRAKAEVLLQWMRVNESKWRR